MKTKEQFVRPAILREVALDGDGRILAGSVVDDMTVVTMGQKVDNYDFSDEKEGFNFDWYEE